MQTLRSPPLVTGYPLETAGTGPVTSALIYCWERSVEGRAAGRALPGSGSSNPSDGGSDSDGTGNLSDLVHNLEQVSKLIGRSIGADLNRVVDTRGLPGFSVEPARRGHPDPSQFDSQRRGFTVDVVEDAAGCREMEQMPASEIGFHRDGAGGPPVREAVDSRG